MKRVESYDVYIKTDSGMRLERVRAQNRKDLIDQLKYLFPDDIGADAWFIDDLTGGEIQIFW